MDGDTTKFATKEGLRREEFSPSNLHIGSTSLVCTSLIAGEDVSIRPSLRFGLPPPLLQLSLELLHQNNNLLLLPAVLYCAGGYPFTNTRTLCLERAREDVKTQSSATRLAIAEEVLYIYS